MRNIYFSKKSTLFYFLGRLFFLEKPPSLYHASIKSVSRFSWDSHVTYDGIIEHLSYLKRLNLFILFGHTTNVYVPRHLKNNGLASLK